MAKVIMKIDFFTASIYGLIIIVPFFIIYFIYAFIFGSPLNDFGIYVLEKRFYELQLDHPKDSVLLEKLKYMGGNSTHGGGVCIFAVGEIRSTSLTEEKIREQYQNFGLTFRLERLKIKLMFLDSLEEDYTLPYADWDGILHNLSDDGLMHYVVYASSEWPMIMPDMRCDD